MPFINNLNLKADSLNPGNKNTIKDIIKHNIELYPNKTAFIFGEKKYTFKEIDLRVNSLIDALKSASKEGRPCRDTGL